MSELLSCPFCGGEASIGRRDYCFKDTGERAITGHYVECGKCYVRTVEYKSESGAVEAWNRRAERTCRMEKDDRYSEMYEGPMLRCTRCDAPVPEIFTGQYNYCPNCGAKVVVE